MTATESRGTMTERWEPRATAWDVPQVVQVALPDGAPAWLKSYSLRGGDPRHEALAIDVVGRLLGRRMVPRVVNSDTHKAHLLLSDVSGGLPSLQSCTKQGRTTPQDAFHVGHAFAQLHRAHQDAPLRSLLPGAVAQQLRWIQRVLGRVPGATGLLAESSLASSALVHGNPSPADFFVGASELRFVDLEDMVVGDPARDLGIFLARFCLSGADLSLINPFLRAYGAPDLGLSHRASRYVGLSLCMDLNAGEGSPALQDLGLRLLSSPSTPLDVALRTLVCLKA